MIILGNVFDDNPFIDFISAALPWVLLGLMVLFAILYLNKENDKQRDELIICKSISTAFALQALSSKDEIVEAMYQFLRDKSKENANIKPEDYSILFSEKQSQTECYTGHIHRSRKKK